MSKVTNSKDDFLDLLEFLDIHFEEEDLYEFIIGWSEEKVIEFANQFDYDWDRFDIQVYEFDEEYIEKELCC
jgi:hypothetical protein